MSRNGSLSIAFVENADHTFTTKEPRAQLVEQVVEVLSRRFGS